MKSKPFGKTPAAVWGSEAKGQGGEAHGWVRRQAGT